MLPQLQSEVDKSNTLRKIIVKDSIEERQAKMLARCLAKGNVCCFMRSPPPRSAFKPLSCLWDYLLGGNLTEAAVLPV